MAGNTVATGMIRNCIFAVFTNGLMAKFTKVSTTMTRRRVLEFTSSKMVENTLAGGLMANNMVLVPSLSRIVSFNLNLMVSI